MQRRKFFQNLGLAAGATALPNILTAKPFPNFSKKKKKQIKPARIREGATIGLIAPAGPTNPEKMQLAIAKLEALGFKTKLGKHVAVADGYLAGSDAQRLEDLHWAFADPEVEVVWCIRGGYGCTRLLEQIDFQLIEKKPKPLVGYSDITALHTSIQQRTGLVTFHGPVGHSDFTDFTIEKLWRVLVNPTPRFEIAAPRPDEMLAGEEYRPETIRSGSARGRLIGGNLCLLAAMAGTPFSPIFKEKIVFLEDVGEEPYRLDRMLTQLLQATDLRLAAGIALGVFQDCEAKSAVSFSRAAVLRERLGGLGIPVVYGIPFGHISNQATLPVGVLAELDAERQVLTLVEFGVV